MLALLFCAVLAEWAQPGVITQCTASLFAHTDRTYKDSPVTFTGQFMITLFRIGIIAMALCLCFCTAGHAPFAAFWVACGCILGILLVKWLCVMLVDYTFSLARRFGTVYEPFSDLFTVGALALYPMVMILLHWGTTIVARWAVGIWALLLIGLWTFRCVRTYLVSLPALLYLLIYIATLEILPMAGLAFLSDKLISLI